jgi:uncharacterized protein
MVLLTVFVLVAGGCSSRQEEPENVPEHRGWVSDYGDVLQPGDEARLADELAAYERETCHQIYVLIMPSLGGENIVDFSKRTAAAWDIGHPGLGNGFLLTLAMDEGAVRIETGSAFEWFIRNGEAEGVLKEVMFPLFRQDRFIAGLEQGLEAIMEAGRLKPIPEDHKPLVCRQ